MKNVFKVALRSNVIPGTYYLVIASSEKSAIKKVKNLFSEEEIKERGFSFSADEEDLNKPYFLYTE